MVSLIAVVGETASGKSQLAMDLARRYNGEIIGADSWTVYRGFSIGTAKPSQAEMQEIPHHLFDIVDAPQGFNAALYKKLALAAITDIQARGKVPIMVGGTGLYIDSVLYDFEFLPAGPVAERDRLNGLPLEEVLRIARSKSIDLDGIDTRNKRRVIRAIETNGARPKRKPLKKDALLIGIATTKESLEQRIIARIDTMLAMGLEAEVFSLAERYGWDVEPMKGIGYAEWHDYFLGEQSLELTRARIIGNTRKLAKRQRTWFKKNSDITWVNTQNDAVDLVTTAFE